ncbi:MAG: shikimate dehydrogenase [Burkholderiales bacterium]|nr:shikimate dehydrogenase [Burkholderiales bacterium]
MPTTLSAPRACVMGHPIAHSRSPLIHGYWLRTLGIDGEYVREDVKPDDFAAFVASLRQRGYVGGNCTVPHKEAAFRLADVTTDRARAVCAVNTLWFEDGRLCGDNTDGIGFVSHLSATQPGWEANTGVALILGAGGAARGIVASLLTAGVERIVIANRTLARAEELARLFGDRVVADDWSALPVVLPAADLLVNTTSLGMQGQPPLEVDIAALRRSAIVADIVYVPLETRLLADARRRRHRTTDGLGMLLHQAVPGFERWFGRRPEVTEELRAIIVHDIERPKAAS